MDKGNYNPLEVNPVALLEILIDRMTVAYSKLERSKHFSSKSIKLDKNKQLIQSLYNIRNSLIYLKLYDQWLTAEQSISDQLKQDPQVTSFIIFLEINQDGNTIRINGQS